MPQKTMQKPNRREISLSTKVNFHVFSMTAGEPSVNFNHVGAIEAIWHSNPKSRDRSIWAAHLDIGVWNTPCLPSRGFLCGRLICERNLRVKSTRHRYNHGFTQIRREQKVENTEENDENSRKSFWKSAGNHRRGDDSDAEGDEEESRQYLSLSPYE